eukprot:5925825-Amphidinium_carterae.1
MQAGHAGPCPQRDYLLTLAANLTFEDAYFQDVLVTLRSQSVWSVIPEDDLNVEHNFIAMLL